MCIDRHPECAYLCIEARQAPISQPGHKSKGGGDRKTLPASLALMACGPRTPA